MKSGFSSSGSGTGKSGLKDKGEKAPSSSDSGGSGSSGSSYSYGSTAARNTAKPLPAAPPPPPATPARPKSEPTVRADSKPADTMPWQLPPQGTTSAKGLKEAAAPLSPKEASSRPGPGTDKAAPPAFSSGQINTHTWRHTPEDAYSGARPTSFQNGAQWPVSGRLNTVPGPTKPVVIDGVSSNRNHAGVDIGAAGGTPIRAPYAGVVVEGDLTAAYGNGLTLNHPGGITTVYGHLRKPSGMEIGRVVEQGEVIGYLGTTGHSSGNHLHWEVKGPTSQLDPIRMLGIPKSVSPNSSYITRNGNQWVNIID